MYIYIYIYIPYILYEAEFLTFSMKRVAVKGYLHKSIYDSHYDFLSR